MDLSLLIVLKKASLIFFYITIAVGVVGLIFATILFPLLTLRKGKLAKTVAPDIVEENGKVQIRDSAAEAFRSVYKEGNKLNLVVFQEVKNLEVVLVLFDGKKRTAREYSVELKDGNIFSLPCESKYFRILVKKINKKNFVRTGYKSFNKFLALAHAILVGGFAFGFLFLTGYFLFAVISFNPFNYAEYTLIYFIFPVASLLLIPVVYLIDSLGAKSKTLIKVD